MEKARENPKARSIAQSREDLEISVERPRCPFCHETVNPNEGKEGCFSCMAWHHTACLEESQGHCSACGQMGMTHIRDLVSQTNNERNAKIQLCLSLAAFIPSLTIIGYFVGGLWEASGNGAWYGFLGGAFIGLFLPSWLAIRHAKNAIKELETAVKDLGDPQQDSGLGDAASASVKASK